MDVETLELALQRITGQEDVKPLMRTIAHWTKRIKANQDRYVTDNLREGDSLKKISELGIIKIEITSGMADQVVATLTAEGEELSLDFFKKGFYL